MYPWIEEIFQREPIDGGLEVFFFSKKKLGLEIWFSASLDVWRKRIIMVQKLKVVFWQMCHEGGNIGKKD